MITKEILWINRRNLQYVKRRNPKKLIRLVDNKYKTKQFLSQRGIPVGETYALINDRKELYQFDFDSILSDSFVVKPNKWSKWRGIFLVKKTKKVHKGTLHWSECLIKWLAKYMPKYYPVPEFTSWYRIGKEYFSDLAFKKKLLPTFDGNYTLWNKPDSILVEEKLIPGNGFEVFCEYGLADMRVIVANLVPVAAMIRVPTKYSWGKANLAQWGVWLGLDIVTGKVKSLKLGKKLYQTKFPKLYEHFQHLLVPFWSDILSYSANVQYFVNLWFIGIDWVITDMWPKLLEVNGKSGLEIQNISMIPLQKILHKIIDLNVPTPRKWVEISKSLFSPQKVSSISKSKVIYLSQKGVFCWKKGEQKQCQDVIVEANTKKKRCYFSQRLASKLKDSNNTVLTLTGGVVLRDVSFSLSDSLAWNRIQLGTNVLERYYIKPIHKSHPSIKFLSQDRIMDDELNDLQILDQKLHEIGKKINLTKFLKPKNYLDEFDKFVSKRGKYNPSFKYDFPRNEELIVLGTDLKKLYDEHQQGSLLKSGFAQLFYEKIGELQSKIGLIKACKKQDFDKIGEMNHALYGVVDAKLFEQSQKHIQTIKNYGEKIIGKKLSRPQIIKSIKKALETYNCKNVKLRLDQPMFSRISVSIADNCAVNLSPHASFGEHELASKLEHEIGVHVRRFLSGKKTGWYLLSKGTAYYQRDEEGLAIYLAEQVYRQIFSNYRNQAVYKNYVLAQLAQEHNFQQLVDIILNGGFMRSTASGYASVFNKVLKLKKGIKHTKEIHPWAIHFMWKMYLEGYKKICDWVENWGNVEQLMIGKIKVEDLEFIV